MVNGRFHALEPEAFQPWDTSHGAAQNPRRIYDGADVDVAQLKVNRRQSGPRHRGDSAVRELVWSACAALGRTEAEADWWADRFHSEWLDDLPQLHAMSDADWCRLGVPTGLRAELRRALAVACGEYKQPRRRPSSAPPGRGGGNAVAARAAVRVTSDSGARRQRGSELEPLRRQLKMQVGPCWPVTLFRLLQSQKTVDVDLLQSALRSLRIVGTTAAQLRTVVRAAAPDRAAPDAEGIISVLHGPLLSQRASAVRAIFDELDTSGRGYVYLVTLKRRCAALEHPLVKSGHLSAAEALQRLLHPWRHVAEISADEFAAGHGALSSLWTGNDDGFARLVCKLWQVPLESPAAIQAGVEQQAKPRAIMKEQPAVASRRRAAPENQELDPALERPGRVVEGVLVASPGQDANVWESVPGSTWPKEARNRAILQASMRATPRVQATVERLQGALQHRGGNAMSDLSRYLRFAGANQGGRVGADDVQDALKQIGVGICDDDAERFVEMGDLDGMGVAHVEQILRLLSTPLNPQRAALVRQVFRRLDDDGDGLVSVRELQERFVPGRHPDVEAGRKSGREVLLELRAGLSEVCCNGRLSAGDFLRFYEGISAGVQSDQYFAHIAQIAWGLDPGPHGHYARNIKRSQQGKIQVFEGGLG